MPPRLCIIRKTLDDLDIYDPVKRLDLSAKRPDDFMFAHGGKKLVSNSALCGHEYSIGELSFTCKEELGITDFPLKICCGG